jgi:predicted homoserine dehydrogenase-like protein
VLGVPGVDVIVEATGNPLAGTEHALAAIDGGQHVVMVTVEADVLVGPLLAERARAAGVVYSLAYGDQPALICELVDWARTTGFEVIAAGKGTKYLPEYHFSTPDTVWGHYGFSPEYAQSSGLNPQMFNSFLDGTKSAIEMAAVANATGLAVPRDGLAFPPCGADDLASVCIPVEDGGVLPQPGVVEVVSSLNRDGTEVARDLRWGVYVTLRAHSDYVADCFRQYGLVTDATGRFTAMYRPYHLIGLELGVSVLSAALRGQPTGAAQGFTADVISIAKRDLVPGDVLDGEGGYTVFGSVIPAADSVRRGLLPIGLAHGARVGHPVRRGEPIRWQDVTFGSEPLATRLRRELEGQQAVA